MTFENAILVAIGGALGAICRYVVSTLWLGKYSKRFPYGTLAVNLPGCFALGLLIGLKVKVGLLLFIGVGFMGGFTTFSTMSVEGASMVSQGTLNKLWKYYAVTFGFGLALTWFGYEIGMNFAT